MADGEGGVFLREDVYKRQGHDGIEGKTTGNDIAKS